MQNRAKSSHFDFFVIDFAKMVEKIKNLFDTGVFLINTPLSDPKSGQFGSGHLLGKFWTHQFGPVIYLVRQFQKGTPF